MRLNHFIASLSNNFVVGTTICVAEILQVWAHIEQVWELNLEVYKWRFLLILEV